MKKAAIPVLLLSLIFACCGEDKSPNNAPEDEEDISSSSLSSSKSKSSSSSKKGSSSSKKNSSSSKTSSSSTKNSSSSETYSTEYKIDPKTVVKGKFTDKRDGRVYKTVTIGDQTWMAENLNYKTEFGSECKADSTDKKCEKKGLRYSWLAIIDTNSSKCELNRICPEPIQGICPDGWRIPTKDEWDSLLIHVAVQKKVVQYLSGTKTTYTEAGRRLRSKDTKGTDVYGFTALTNIFWTSGNSNLKNTYYIGGYTRASTFDLTNSDAEYISVDRTEVPAYLRCIQDTTPKPDLNNPATIKSRIEGCEDKVWTPRVKPCNINGKDNCEYGEFDGYKTVKIGKRTWMNADRTLYPIFGSAATCPFGWRVPDPDDWNELIEDVGGNCFAAKMLASQRGWENGNGFNAYGLNIRPIGYREAVIDYTMESASAGREYYGSGTKAAFVVRFSSEKVYNHIAFLSTPDPIVISINRNYTPNLYCVNSIPAPDKSDSLLKENFNYGEYTDSRDGKKYKTTIIGPQKWMAQNLNYETKSSLCYQNHVYSDLSSTYGRLYSFEDAQTACPTGYHLPTKEDFDTLYYFGAQSHSPNNLITTYYTKDLNNKKRYDRFGFSATYAGYATDSTHFDGYYDKDAKYPSGYAIYWSSYINSENEATVLKLSSYDPSLYITTTQSDKYYSIRCINDTTFSIGYTGEYGTLTDERDSQIYKTVEINGVTWMAENLRYKTQDSTWSYCYLDSCAKYGRYYEYPLTRDSAEALCPTGWHVPTESDWEKLIEFVGDSSAFHLQSIYGWEITKNSILYYTERQGDDKYGFNIIPNGCLERLYFIRNGFTNLNKEGRDHEACLGISYPKDTSVYSQYYYKAGKSTSLQKEILGDPLTAVRCVKD